MDCADFDVGMQYVMIMIAVLVVLIQTWLVDHDGFIVHQILNDRQSHQSENSGSETHFGSAHVPHFRSVHRRQLTKFLFFS